MNTFFKHRVIILNRGSIPRKRKGGITTCQRHSVTSPETARSLANGPSFAEGEVCILRSPGGMELQRLLSLFFIWEESVGGA